MNVAMRSWGPMLGAVLLWGCGGATADPATQHAPASAPSAGEETIETAPVPIKDAYKDYFTVGVAVPPHLLTTLDELIRTNFNRLTAENDMKAGPLRPAPDSWKFNNADAIANYARRHGMKMTGHTLIWHNMQPGWFFADLTPGDPQSIETLRERMKTHIFTLVERYADVIDNWDVVNEAISDDPKKAYRDGAEGSKWFEIYGDQSYVYDAFRFAKEALEKAAGSAEGKLYYNDYNIALPHKLENTLALVKWLRDEKGIPIDGVGLQGHWQMAWPSVDEIQHAIDRITAEGLKVKISELDISIYPKDDWANKVWEPEKPFTEALQEEQAARFQELFALFRKNKDVITSVTLWGVTDSNTWLDTFPIPRNNYPLLFDDDHNPKLSVRKITTF